MRNVLLTGATGFLGKNLKKGFEETGQWKVTTLGRKPQNDIQMDLAKGVPVLSGFDAVVHAAGLAHQIEKKTEWGDYWINNVVATENLIKGIERQEPFPWGIIYLSTVAVYGVQEGELLEEETTPAPTTFYGESKLEAERLFQQFCLNADLPLLILRLPLVYGPDAPGNIRKMKEAIRRNRYFRIAGGKARRSMVLTSDIGTFLPQWIGERGIYHLTDGSHPSFEELENGMVQSLQKKKPPELPMFMAKMLALAGDVIGPSFPFNSGVLKKMTSTLTFSDEKAREELGWKPTRVIDSFSVE